MICRFFDWINAYDEKDLYSDKWKAEEHADWQGFDSEFTFSYGCKLCFKSFPEGFDRSKYCNPDNDLPERNYENCPMYKEYFKK